MAWYDEAVFYHIYPLGAVGAPGKNEYGEPVHRLRDLFPWIDHMKRMHFNALYIGPLFESVGHGYETTDYKKLDSRLGTNEDLTDFVARCHENGIRVILDGVFNHTGRDFFAFQDLKANREQSPYRDWYCNVNFWGNNEYNDGFSYDNWGGFNLLVKLNQRNPAVRDYICGVVRFWVETFDIDGIRLDAADVLDFDFMRQLRGVADSVKPDFWLMGEVIHGDYSRWANDQTLHSVTNYTLHKALYSGHNDHNYFEIAHTVKRNNDMVPAHIKLYNFVDNHDVERIYTKLRNKAHYAPVHILLYTLPGIPSVYYGSEFGIEGRKDPYSDAPLRPHIEIGDYANALEDNACAGLVSRLGQIHRACPDLVWGAYRELSLTTEQFAFARGEVIVAVNNADHDAQVRVQASCDSYTGLLCGAQLASRDGWLEIALKANSGEIFAPGDAPSELAQGAEAAREGAVGGSGSVEPPKPSAADRAEAADQAGEPAPTKAQGRKPESTGAGDAKAAPPASEKAEGVESESPAPEMGDAAKPAPTGARIPEPKREERAAGGQQPQAQGGPEGVPYGMLSIAQLQEIILGKMAKNGPVTDQMRRDVLENIWHDSLVKWAESFR